MPIDLSELLRGVMETGLSGFESVRFPERVAEREKQFQLAEREQELLSRRIAHEEEASELDRLFRAAESEKQRTFTSGESELDRFLRQGESALTREFQAGESALTREFRAGESVLDRNVRISQAKLDRIHRTSENLKTRMQSAIESMRARGFREGESQLEREFKRRQAMLDRELQRELARMKLLMARLKGKEEKPLTYEQSKNALSQQLKLLDETFEWDKAGKTAYIKLADAPEGVDVGTNVGNRRQEIISLFHGMGFDVQIEPELTWWAGKNKGFKVAITGYIPRAAAGEVATRVPGIKSATRPATVEEGKALMKEFGSKERAREEAKRRGWTFE